MVVGGAFHRVGEQDGRVATRNFIGILSSVNCSATVIKHIAAHFTPERLAAYPNVDGVVAFAQTSGCGMSSPSYHFDVLRRTISGYVRHPNLAGALIGLATALGACTHTDETATTASIPDDYRLRHPIAIQESNRSIVIFVGQARGGLSAEQRADVMGLAQVWLQEGTGAIVADVPVGTYDVDVKLFADGLLLAQQRTALETAKVGFEQFVASAAREHGVVVFNAPYSNTRSVAELVLAEAILLLRGVPEKSAVAHCGGWLKSADNAFEIRGKTLGIVGYGSIGAQLSVLAEALGMQVAFFDVVTKLPLGNARQVRLLPDLLAQLYLSERNEEKYQSEMLKILDVKARNAQHLAHFVNYWIGRNQLDHADRWLAELKKAALK